MHLTSFFMSRPFYTCLCLAVAGWIVSCNQKSNTFGSEDGLASFNVDSLTNHIIALSSDEFQGRRPFTGGETRTVDYFANLFTNLGLGPGNRRSYFFDVPLVGNTSSRGPTMKVQTYKRGFCFKRV